MTADTLDGPTEVSMALASWSSDTCARSSVTRTWSSRVSSCDTAPTACASWCHSVQRMLRHTGSGTSAGLHQAATRRRGRLVRPDLSTVMVTLAAIWPAHCTSSSASM